MHLNVEQEAYSFEVSALDSFDLPRHRWYFVKEAFAPQVVVHAIKDMRCNEEDLIIDPFSGGGTVALTATIHGYRAVGVEVNPFLAFMSRVKLLQYEAVGLRETIDKVILGIKEGFRSKLEDFSTFSEAGGAAKWLFNREVLRGFEGGWRAAESLDTTPRDLIRLSLIRAAMDVCNAVKDGKCLRYRSGWSEVPFGKSDLMDAFVHHASNVVQDLTEDPLARADSTIKLGDARTLSLSDLA